MMNSKLKYCSITLVFLVSTMAGPTTMAQQKAVKPTGVKAKTKLLQVNGVVTDLSTGKPLAGVNVTYGKIAADLTDEKGLFTIGVPSLDVEIHLSAEGYEQRQVALKGRDDLKIALVTETGKSFQQNITLQHGSMPLRNTSSAIAAYNVNGNWSRPFESIDELLQGQVAGLQAIRRSGATAKGANLTLRGANSLFGTNTPLIIVDGMLYDPADYGNSLIGGIRIYRQG